MLSIPVLFPKGVIMLDVLRLATFCLSFLGFVVFLARRIAAPPFVVPFLVVNLTVLCLYLAAIGGVLRPAAMAIHAAGFVLLARSLWAICRTGTSAQRRADRVLLGRLAVAFVPLTIFWWFSRSLTCTPWDEYSHWAFAVKEMWHTNALPSPDTHLQFPQYPPAAALYRYFTCQVLGFSEANMYFAHISMLYCATLVFFQRVRWTPWLVIVSTALLGYFLAFLWRDSFLHLTHIMHLGGWAAGGLVAYVLLRKRCRLADMANVFLIGLLMYVAYYVFFGRVSLYADSLVGIYLGTIAADALLSRSSVAIRLGLAAPALGTLTLTKDVGYLFASFGSVLIMALTFLEYRRASVRLLWKLRWQRLVQACRRRSAALASVVAVAMIPHVAYGSWTWYVAHAGYGTPVSSPASLVAGVRGLAVSPQQGINPLTEDQQVVLQEFKKALFYVDICEVRMASLGHASMWAGKALSRLNQILVTAPGSAARWSCWIWTLTLLLLGAGAALLLSERRELWCFLLLCVMFMGGFVLYLLFLLAMYLFVFPHWWAVKLASFPRYVAPFVCAWFMAVVAGFVRSLYRPFVRWRAALFLAATTLMMFSIAHFRGFNLQTLCAPHPDRSRIRELSEHVNAQVPPDARVFIIWQHSRGYEFYMTRYEIYPRRSQIDAIGYSLCVSDTNNKDDLYRWVKSPGEFARMLAGYDYLLVGYADGAFWSDYAALFQETLLLDQHFLFKIVTKHDSTTLVPI